MNGWMVAVVLSKSKKLQTFNLNKWLDMNVVDISVLDVGMLIGD